MKEEYRYREGEQQNEYKKPFLLTGWYYPCAIGIILLGFIIVACTLNGEALAMYVVYLPSMIVSAAVLRLILVKIETARMKERYSQQCCVPVRYYETGNNRPVRRTEAEMVYTPTATTAASAQTPPASSRDARTAPAPEKTSPKAEPEPEYTPPKEVSIDLPCDPPQESEDTAESAAKWRDVAEKWASEHKQVFVPNNEGYAILTVLTDSLPVALAGKKAIVELINEEIDGVRADITNNFILLVYGKGDDMEEEDINT